ncbi:BolA family transcriptional regulator [bacterium]|nr:BolA family transcriptional regulator [bacterium]|tara:strand:- start:2289 stop:2549 length:261 start_codon:yes stop_codon:yes gene_type:complete
MDINQLSQIIIKKILDHKIIKNVEVEDKSFLHKNHKSNEAKKFHLKLKIKSEELKKKNKIVSNKFIYKILYHEMKLYIHSLQILFI